MHSISSTMLLQPHWSCEVLPVKWIDWLDLPKLTTLKTNNNGNLSSGTFAYVYHIVLESDSHPLWMTFRHAQSHQCVSHRVCIRVQYWRCNNRKYSHRPSFTTRHRSSSKLLQLITERYVIHPLCATHYLSNSEPSRVSFGFFGKHG